MPEAVASLHEHYRSEVAAASHAFYLWKGINNIAAADRGTFRGINEQALTWNTITHSLQTTFFIALGRLFDTDGDAFSIHAFLKGCIENIAEFDRPALHARKLALSNGVEPDWLARYVANAYVPTVGDFQRLRGEASKHQAHYEAIYRPIRNQVFAHKDAGSMDSLQGLFGKTKISDIEQLLDFLYQVQEVVFQLFQNGELRKVGEFQNSEETLVVEDVSDLLKRIRMEPQEAYDA
jgi:hypothetical protein